MRLVIITGMSGAGKSHALHTLEDHGFYCIDNLPLELINNALDNDYMSKQDMVAIGIDIRNGGEHLQMFPDIMNQLKNEYETDIIYLYAGKSVLTKRYDETRRKHPLTDASTPLSTAITKEYDDLAPVREVADIKIDTSSTDIYELSSQIKNRVCGSEKQNLSLIFQSFGFKHGTPRDSDYIFDVRCLPNPYWIPELRGHTGLEPNVSKWLSEQKLVQDMEESLTTFIKNWIPHIIASQRAYLTISIGCTGGHHRSVYLTEKLGEYFGETYKDSIIIQHRELIKCASS